MKESKDEDFNQVNWKGHPAEDNCKKKSSETISHRWKKTRVLPGVIGVC